MLTTTALWIGGLIRRMVDDHLKPAIMHIANQPLGILYCAEQLTHFRNGDGAHSRCAPPTCR